MRLAALLPMFSHGRLDEKERAQPYFRRGHGQITFVP